MSFIATFFSLLFGLTNNQTAYLNVLALPVVSASAPALSSAPTCDITLLFFDGQSNLIKSTEVIIDPGGSTTYSLTSKEVKSLGKERVLVYGEVGVGSDSDVSCVIQASLELVDPEGRQESLTPLAARRGPTTF